MPPASNPDSAYSDNGDGTVTHTPTGLIWKRCAEGQIWSGGTCTGSASSHTWAQALTLASSSSFAGKTDWRLPSIKELRSLVEECRVGPAINDTIFPNTPGSYFWSGSPDASYSYNAWFVNFSNGYASYGNRNGSRAVRLVRGGQSFDNLGANMAPPSCTLTASPASITAGGSSTLTASCSPAATSYKWVGTSCANAGATCVVTPATTTTYTMAGVNTAGQGPSAQATVTVTGAAKYALSVQFSGSGSGSVSSSQGGMVCNASCVASIDDGAHVTLTATPTLGNRFVGWSGACSGTGLTCDLTIRATTTVTAEFAAIGACEASDVVLIVANGFAFAHKYQAFDVVCGNGSYGGVRLPPSINPGFMPTCAFQESSCAKAADTCMTTRQNAAALDEIYAGRNGGLALLNNPVVGPLARWICQP